MAKEKIQVTLALQSDFTAVESDLKKLQGKLAGLGLPGLQSKNIGQELTELQAQLAKLKGLSGTEFSAESDFSQVRKDIEATEKRAKSLLETIQKLETQGEKKKIQLLPQGQQDQINKAITSLKDYSNVLAKIQKQKAELDKKKIKLDLIETASSDANTKLDAFRKGKSLPMDPDIDAAIAEQEARVGRVEEAYKKKKWVTTPTGKNYRNDVAVDTGQEKVGLKSAQGRLQELKEFKILLEAAAKAESELYKERAGYSAAESAFNIDSVIAVKTAYKDLRITAQQLGIDISDISDTFNNGDADKLKTRLEALKTQGLDQVDSGLGDIKDGLKNVSPTLQQTTDDINTNQKAWEDLLKVQDAEQKRIRDLANLKDQLLSFFSISGTIDIFKTAIRQAFETVKELDEAMTEIAVVSDFSVNEMWGTLPEFTDQANQLGMAISDAYYATTLFVQQGLELDASMQLATETLKMAAVAGMDAANATDAMTSA